MMMCDIKMYSILMSSFHLQIWIFWF